MSQTKCALDNMNSFFYVKIAGTVPARKIIQVKQVLYLEDLIESFLHWLTGESYTPVSHVLVDFLLTPGVWYPGDIDFAQYDTPGRLTPQSMMPQGDS